jgi:hypothetical protein
MAWSMSVSARRSLGDAGGVGFEEGVEEAAVEFGVEDGDALASGLRWSVLVPGRAG